MCVEYIYVFNSWRWLWPYQNNRRGKTGKCQANEKVEARNQVIFLNRISFTISQCKSIHLIAIHETHFTRNENYMYSYWIGMNRSWIKAHNWWFEPFIVKYIYHVAKTAIIGVQVFYGFQNHLKMSDYSDNGWWCPRLRWSISWIWFKILFDFPTGHQINKYENPAKGQRAAYI